MRIAEAKRENIIRELTVKSAESQQGKQDDLVSSDWGLIFSQKVGFLEM